MGTVKDLDFDELDKAVNSLMAGVPKAPVASDKPPEKSLNIDISSSDKGFVSGDNSNGTTKVTPTNSAPSTGRIDRENASSDSRLAPRRGGRFMDVVHPSSDMKKSELARPVSREGAVVEPENDLLAAKSEPSPLPPAPLEIPSSPVSPSKSQTSPPSPRSDWPDPLEVANLNETKQPEPVDEVTSLPNINSRVPRSTDQLSNTAEPPLISPFLSDTKVEKRPLGGNIVPSEDEQTQAQEGFPNEDTSDGQLPATIEDTKPLLPAELHRDLMAIESDASEPAEAPVPLQAAALSKPPVETSDQNQQYENKEVIEEAAAPVESPKTEPAPMPTGPVSIPQQYKEEPSSSEPKSGAIYDTDSYHQPLAHPAKQKSGWLWIVWIILILLLGAGVGAALYFFGLV